MSPSSAIDPRHPDPASLLAVLAADGEIITERLDHWVGVTPEAPLLHYGEESLTLSYAEFGDLTDRIAGNLAAHGIAKGDRVSVLTTNSHIAAVLMFAIWKAGAVYCPVNFAYTGRLLAYQLDDTAPALLITDATHLPAVNDVAVELRHLPTVVVYAPEPGAHDHVADVAAVNARFATSAWADLVAAAPRPAVTVGFDDPANIVYTSGTTGPAKGVVQPYRWMAQYTFGLRAPLTADDVIYSDLPMYHVGGAIANVARAAWVGCSVALWDRFSPSDFWRRIASCNATTAILLDVMIPWLMNAEPRTDDRANTLNKVYMQPLPLHHAQVAQRFGFDFVLAGFGQTESGATVSAFIEETTAGAGTPDEHYRGLDHADIIDRAQQRGIRVLSGAEVTRKGFMGSPGPFCEVTIRDDHDGECGVDEPGQLAVRPRLPALTMLGYHNKPEATVAAWRNLWLHTGDAAVRAADGTIYFVDRLGDRIRVRGESLSSFQVEDLVNQHPAVQYCAAFAIASESGDEDDVVVFVVPAEGVVLTVEDIDAHAAAVMPKYMRPRIVRIVDDLPRTATNKIEKYRLRTQIVNERAQQPSVSPGSRPS
ncbi:AMP-binding protein [Gordonia sp. NPDC003429]